MNRVFSKSQIQRYIFMYIGVIILILIFFFLNKNFSQERHHEKKVFSTTPSIKRDSSSAQSVGLKEKHSHIKVLDKAY